MIPENPIRLDALPASARAKLAHLQQQAVDAHSLTETARASFDKLETKRMAIERRRKLAQSHDPAAAAELERELREVEASLGLAREAMRKRQEVAGAHAQILAQVRQWVAGARPGTLVSAEASPSVLENGESVTAAIERTRRSIAGLQLDLTATRRAPLPAAAIKQRVREQVAAAAERGRPRVDAGGNIAWGTSDPHMAPFAVASEVLDLLAWLNPQTIIARLLEADLAGDQAGALSEPERVRKVRSLEARLLAAERGEEALIEQAEREGQAILRRSQADPRAVLGVELRARAAQAA